MAESPLIGVIGGGSCTNETASIATEVGELIARENAILICGGLGGVMEAACRGAKLGGGRTIGVLPGKLKSAANVFVDIAIPTDMGDARNIIIVRSADAVIALDGEFGTLSEMAFCLKFHTPLVSLNSWKIDPAIVHATSPEDAVRKALSLAQG